MTGSAARLCEPHPDPPNNDFSDPAERLFRRIRTSDVHGEAVTATAVDFPPGWSFNRELYSAPADVLANAKPEFTGVAALRVGQIPALFRAAEVNWTIYPEHVPCAGNWAHTEVRARREGTDFDPERKVGSKLQRKLLRDMIARRLTVVVAPQ